MSMKKRFSALVLITVVAVVGWFALAFRPAHSRLGELRDEVEQSRTELSALQERLERLQALQRNENQIRDEAVRMAAALPSEPAVSDFILRVQDAANAAGIDFLTITPALPAVPAGVAAAQPAAPSDAELTDEQREAQAQAEAAAAADPVNRLRSIEVQVKADGGFFAMEQFIANLERLGRAVRLDDFTLATGGGDAADTLSASMKLNIFMLAPQAAAGAGTGTAAAQPAPTTTGAG